MAQRSAAGDFEFKGLILDYGEVLSIKPTAEQIERMAGIFGISASHFTKLYDRSRREYDRGDLSAERYWFSFADEPGVRLRTEQIPLLRAWDVEMWSNTDPQMIAWLRAIRLSGMRTALLSNMPGDMIAQVRTSCWIDDFDCTVFSNEERIAKPETAIYERCLAKLGTPRDQTLFVDDRDMNVRAAQNLGMRAIRFESVPLFRAQLEKLHILILPELPIPAPA